MPRKTKSEKVIANLRRELQKSKQKTQRKALKRKPSLQKPLEQAAQKPAQKPAVTPAHPAQETSEEIALRQFVKTDLRRTMFLSILAIGIELAAYWATLGK